MCDCGCPPPECDEEWKKGYAEGYARGKRETLDEESVQDAAQMKAYDMGYGKAVEDAAKSAEKEGNCGATFTNCDECECGTEIAKAIRGLKRTK